MKPSKPSPLMRHHVLSHERMLASTPGCSLATAAAAPSGLPVEDRGRGLLCLLLPGRDESRAPSRQQGVQDPAFGPLRIAHLAPRLELRRDLHRQAGALEDPGRAVVLRRTLAEVDAIRLEADVARHGQSAGGAHLVCRDAPRAENKADKSGAERERDSSPPSLRMRLAADHAASSSLWLRRDSLLRPGSCVWPAISVESATQLILSLLARHP